MISECFSGPYKVCDVGDVGDVYYILYQMKIWLKAQRKQMYQLKQKIEFFFDGWLTLSLHLMNHQVKIFIWIFIIYHSIQLIHEYSFKKMNKIINFSCTKKRTVLYWNDFTFNETVSFTVPLSSTLFRSQVNKILSSSY